MSQPKASKDVPKWFKEVLRLIIGVIGSLLFAELMGWVDLRMLGSMRTALDAYLHLEEITAGLVALLGFLGIHLRHLFELSTLFRWIFLLLKWSFGRAVRSRTIVVISGPCFTLLMIALIFGYDYTLQHWRPIDVVRAELTSHPVAFLFHAKLDELPLWIIAYDLFWSNIFAMLVVSAKSIEEVLFAPITVCFANAAIGVAAIIGDFVSLRFYGYQSPLPWLLESVTTALFYCLVVLFIMQFSKRLRKTKAAMLPPAGMFVSAIGQIFVNFYMRWRCAAREGICGPIMNGFGMNKLRQIIPPLPWIVTFISIPVWVLLASRIDAAIEGIDPRNLSHFQMALRNAPGRFIKGLTLVAPLYVIRHFYAAIPVSAVVLALTWMIIPDLTNLIVDYQSEMNPEKEIGSFGFRARRWEGFYLGIGAIAGEVGGWIAAMTLSNLSPLV